VYRKHVLPYYATEEQGLEVALALHYIMKCDRLELPPPPHREGVSVKRTQMLSPSHNGTLKIARVLVAQRRHQTAIA
jgi:hypothetical protein